MVHLDYCGEGNRFLDDTWTYSECRWRQVQSSRRRWWGLLPAKASPSPRCGHSLAYDKQAEVAVLFGGIDPNDNPLGDTWVFDGAIWKRVAGRAPPARRYAAFAYDPDLQGCLLHGGAEDDHGNRKFGDTWLFRDNSWACLGRRFETDCRDDHGLAFHQKARLMVMLEGINGVRGLLARKTTGWQPLVIHSLHPRHQCSPLTWDDELGGLLLHGGEIYHAGPQLDETLLLRISADENFRARMTPLTKVENEPRP